MSLLLGCQIYVSEGRNPKILSLLAKAAKAAPHVFHLQTFVDDPYNRSSYLLASRDQPQLQSAILQLAETAIGAVDLRHHEASHPRLGVVDHISCHPLVLAAQSTTPGDAPPGPSYLEPALQEAGAFARGLAAAAADRLRVPVYTYGYASQSQTQLDEIRRGLGYFKGSGPQKSKWLGALTMQPAPPRPDFGPQEPDAARGVACVGAAPWITNFNIQLVRGAGLEVGRKLARAVSQRTVGGMPGVQSMALEHASGSVEVACNLLDYSRAPPELVEQRVRQLARAEGTDVAQSYVIGRRLPDIIKAAEAKALGEGAAAAAEARGA